METAPLARPESWLLKYQSENFQKSLHNPNENLVRRWLFAKTDFKWNRQVIHRQKIFDFWCEEMGVRIEVDGETHHTDLDAQYDAALESETAIVTIRIRNCSLNTPQSAIDKIKSLKPWNQRLLELGKSTADVGVPFVYEHEDRDIGVVQSKMHIISSRLRNKRKRENKRLRKADVKARVARAREERRELDDLYKMVPKKVRGMYHNAYQKKRARTQWYSIPTGLRKTDSGLKPR